MKKILIFFIVILLNCYIVNNALAVYDPKTTPNNKFGIHILFPSELARAAELVNSNGGDWGYVTIPIQYSDRDLVKWQAFMIEARKYHIIPILRMATDAHHANTSVWRKPNEYDVVDFANFLNSLNWPIKNRYVMFYNEINRNDEWGGTAPSPEDYADFLSYAVNVFRAQNPNFFIIAAGLDNASPNDGVKYLDNFVFLQRMGKHNSEVFKKIDGFSSHSYPNPNFAQPPSKTKAESTSTYKFEQNIIEGFAGTKKPIFITETGWNADALPASVIASYYEIAMKDIWGPDVNIIAVTPFVLESNGGPFDKFTFTKGGQFTVYAQKYKDLTKIKGSPLIDNSKNILAVTTRSLTSKMEQEIKFEPVGIGYGNFSSLTKLYFKTIFGMGK